MLEISQAAYSNLERNETEMTVTRVFEIAEIFEMSPFELMPKPKFGSGIHYHGIVYLIRKFSWFRNKEKEVPKFMVPAI